MNELINEHYKFSDCVEKLDIKCDGGGAEKIRRRRDWSVDDFDAMEIRRGKSTEFDGAVVCCLVVSVQEDAQNTPIFGCF